MILRYVVLTAMVVLVPSCSPDGEAGGPGVESAAKAFMDAYVAGDWQGVERSLTDGPLYVYGSDLSEYSTDRAGLKTMFDNDQKLWRGTGRLGAMSQMSSIRHGDIATLFLNRVFEVGGRKVNVRFSTVWQREHGEWKLVQSSNAVPTVGQSAAEILAHPSP